MNTVRQIAYAVFVVFLCVIPVFASAQDEESISRLIDMPNIEGDNDSLALTEAVRTALGDATHLVFSEEEMRNAAKEAKLSEEYWINPDDVVALNKNLRHDAILVSSLEGGKKVSLSVTIYNAFTGELVGSFEQKLKKKNKLSKDETKSLIKQVNELVKTIDANNYPYEIVITVNSEPSGATITKDGVVIGTTPYEYKATEIPGATEEWVISLPDREPVKQIVAMDSTNTYNIKFKNEVVVEEPTKPQGGTGRPVFLVAVNASPSIHSFQLSDELNTALSHKSSVYPLFSMDLAFFPFPLFSTNDYLQGLGLQINGGFAMPLLNTKFGYSSTDDISKVDCTVNGDNTYTCKTMEYRVTADIVYRLLLQKTEKGKLNPNGMALDFFAGFNWFNHIVNTNLNYNGNNYGGIRAGVAFSTPLGLDQLRLSVKGAFVYHLLSEDGVRVNKLGEKRDMSLGAQGGLDVLYDIYKGLFVHAGYNLLFVHSNYSGFGCSNTMNNDSKHCTKPKNSTVNDMFHEIVLGVGYMLY